MNLTSREPAAFRSVLTALLVLVPGLLFASSPAHAQPGQVVISQVYGGGGTLYTHDFIELHNRGTTTVTMNNWSVQFSDVGSSSWEGTVFSGIIPPGGYYLIRAITGAGGGALLPTPDASGALRINAVAGKVALVNRSNLLSGSPPLDASGVVDKLGYGAVNYSEGPPLGPLSATTAALRLAGGCTDTDNNLNDFAIGIPNPRNSASPLVPCGPVSVSLASAPNPSRVGESVNLTATVSPPAATGTVEFFDGVTSLGSSALVSGSAVLAVTSLTLGAHSLTAVYSGDGTYTGNTSPAHNHSVIQAATATSLASAPDPSAFGQSVTLTATVTVDPPGAGSPSGTVEFFDGMASLGTSQLVAGQAALPTTALAVGARSLTAVYSGDPNFATSTSAVDPLTVNQASTTTSLASAPDPSVFGQSVTLTATVTVDPPGAGSPSGTVEFFDGMASLGTSQLVAGQATVSTPALVVGPHSLTAVYSGDVNFSGNTSAGEPHVVIEATTSTSLSSAPDPSLFGQMVTLTATVAAVAPGAGLAGGTIEFFDGVTLLGTSPLVAGQAQFTTSSLAVGAHSLTAVYSGDTFFLGSTSPVDGHVVNSVSSSVSLASAPNPSRVGESVNLTATVSPPAATGAVQFFDGMTLLGTSQLLSGSTVLTTSALTLGLHSLTAVYSGDLTYTGNTSPAHNHSVIQAATTTSLASAPDPSVSGQSVTLTATVAVNPPGAGSPSGTVEFFEGVNSLGSSPLVAGQAQFATAALPIGVYSLTAVYSGDASFATSTSAVDPHTVDPVGALVVVSQIYGGSGQIGATYTHDYIELFNRSAHSVNLTNWSVQFAPTNTDDWTGVSLSGQIPAHSYFLVRLAGPPGVSVPPPDAMGSIDLDGLSGKVALVNNDLILPGTCPDNTAKVDLVGYGTTDCSETAPTLELTNSIAAFRKLDGCIDTDNNFADFTAGDPTPRNSASPTNDCMFTLTVVLDEPGEGTVTQSPDLPAYPAGSQVQLTAVATGGFHFDRWSGDATGSCNPLSVTMNSDLTITAHFVSNDAAGQMVISQFFGGGGEQGAEGRKHDYVELYNRGNGPVDVENWTLQFAPVGTNDWNATPLLGEVEPGHYLLVQLAAGAVGTDLLPAPDVVGALVLAASAGKLALVRSDAVLAGACPSGISIVDFVGYGGADCSETAPAASLSNDQAAFRGRGGCDETQNNQADFFNGAPQPRNSATDPHFCKIWVDVETEPTALALSMPMPNPSRGGFNFSLGLPAEGMVRVSITDVQGRRIASLLDGRMPAGRHHLSWTGVGTAGPVRSGLYYLTLENMGQRLVRRVVVVR